MKLTTEQRSEIISEMASSEAGFNELMRVLLDSFSSRSAPSFSKSIKENRATVSVLVVGVVTVAVFNFASPHSLGCFSTDHTRHLGCLGKRACAAFS